MLLERVTYGVGTCYQLVGTSGPNGICKKKRLTVTVECMYNKLEGSNCTTTGFVKGDSGSNSDRDIRLKCKCKYIMFIVVQSEIAVSAHLLTSCALDGPEE